MTQLVTLSFYSARLTLSTYNSKLGASVRKSGKGPSHWQHTQGFSGVVGQCISKEDIYCCSLFWEEIMADINIAHSVQLSGGSCLNKLQHAHTL